MFTHFYNMLSDILVSKNQSAMLAVCCIDIDNFSAVNRDSGSNTGDRILKELEERLSRWLGPNDFMAHSTADQFYLCIDVKHKMAIFRQLQDQIELPFRIDDHLYSLSASIGISLLTPQHKSPDRAIRNAMHACITVKNSGGGKFEIFDDEGLQIRHQKSALIDEVTKALTSHQLQLFLQPKVKLDDRTLAGFEALIRW